MRRDGREVECDGLEIRYTVFPYRGFESLSFRHSHQKEIQAQWWDLDFFISATHFYTQTINGLALSFPTLKTNIYQFIQLVRHATTNLSSASKEWHLLLTMTNLSNFAVRFFRIESSNSSLSANVVFLVLIEIIGQCPTIAENSRRKRTSDWF